MPSRHGILALGACASVLWTAPARAGPDSYYIGNGQDGSVTIAAASTVVNSYAQIAAAASAGATTVTVASTTGFAANDLVLLVQMVDTAAQPTSTAPADLTLTGTVGRFELARVSAVLASPARLQFTVPLLRSYVATASQVVQIPEYVNLTVSAGASVVATPWNGATGGIVAFMASGTVTADGSVSANAAGFAGGVFTTEAADSPGCVALDEASAKGGQKGQGIIPKATNGYATVGNGGGGGNCNSAGGGGGGGRGRGGNGGMSHADDGTRDVGGRGGVAILYDGKKYLTLGGGGGAGHGNKAGRTENGGAGGGIVFIRANALTGAGSVTAHGQDAPQPFPTTDNGQSGGGGGGTIYVRIVNGLTVASIGAHGGLGASHRAGEGRCNGPGGGGGGGNLTIQAAAITSAIDTAAGSPGTSIGNTGCGVGGTNGAASGAGGEDITLTGGFTLPAAPAMTSPPAGCPTGNKTPAITGTAPASTTVVVYEDNATQAEVCRTTSDTSGNWSCTLTTPLSLALHLFQAATEIDEVESAKTADAACEIQAEVNFTAASQANAESVATVTVTAQLSEASTFDVSLPFTVTGTASNPADYTITASPITIPAGSTSANVTLTVVNDSLDELDETVIVTMGTPTHATVGVTPVHTATITDNDPPPGVSFTAASQSGAESAGSMTVTAQLSAASGLDVTVPFTVTGTAASAADYTITASPITIPAGSTTANITITVVNDTLDELDETVIVTMGAPANATAGATAVHTAAITDDDPTPAVNFTAAGQSAAESAGIMTVMAQLSAVSGLDVTVPFAVPGTAANPADYAITPSPIMIPAGSATASITITVAEDALDEDDETVIVTMGAPTNATVGATSVHTATITDNDPLPSVTFTTASQSAAEPVATMTVTAQLSAVSGRAVTIPFTLSGTTANPADYTTTASPIVIPAGSTTASITITVVDDALDEDDETVIVTMGAPTNATAGATTVHTATITDNDPPPTVSFTAVNQSGAEPVGTMTITAQLSVVSGRAVTVPFTLSGTAASPADYTITASPITIPTGSTTASITIVVVNDTLDELDETVIVTMGLPTNATDGATTVHTAAITDNDPPPTVSFSAASQSAAESPGSMTVTALLSAASGLDVTVPFAVSGTATNPADYTITASPITILAGTTSGTITISVVNDALNEDDETVIVTMGVPTNATAGAAPVHTATITDNDAFPAVSFTAASQSTAEGIGTMTVTAQLSDVSGRAVTIPFSLSGTAANPADYTATASPMVIPAGSTTASITITVVDDALDEDDETVIATMGVPTNATAGATTVHTATMTDNDPLPSVSFSAANQSGAEPVGTMTVTAQLSVMSGRAVTVPFTLSGTAASPADYTTTPSPIVIPAGSTTASITIVVVNDTLDELDETVIVTMGAPTNATAGAAAVHTATITDDDPPPSVTFTATSQSAAEPAGTMTVTAQLSAASGLDVTVPFTVSGTATNPADYTITASPITILAGSTLGSITISVVNDALNEDDETVIVTMGAPTNAAAGASTVHTAAITDNDVLPTVSFTVASQSAVEGIGTMTVTAQLSDVSGRAVTVPFALSGTAANPADYTTTASPIAIPAGSTTASITITVVDDVLDEDDETAIVTMGVPTNATAGATTVHTAAITDNDPLPSVTFTPGGQTGAESAGTMTVTAQLSVVSGRAVTVPFTLSGTAASPADYTITASPITILTGSTTASITITVVNDALDELDETVIVTMGPPTNATAGATDAHAATITDNDPPPSVSFTSSAQSAVESAGSVTVTAQLSAVSGLDVTVPFVLSGTAANPADYTATASPIVIPAGSTSAGMAIAIAEDALHESSETIIVTMGGPTNATAGATAGHTVTITDNDAAPSVAFTAAAQSPPEAAGIVAITAQLSAVSGLDVTVPFTLSGTASNPADYTISATPILIPAGSTSTAMTITLIDDALDEDDETAIVAMGLPTNATLGATGVHTLTIADNDPLPSVSFTSGSQSGAEPAGTMTVTVQLPAVSGRAVSVPFTLSGTAATPADYSTTASPIVIAPGTLTASMTITIFNDALDEPDETVVVTMGAPTNATQGATTVHAATITDNDPPPTVNFTAANQSIAESAGSATVTAFLSAVSSFDVTVPFVLSGTASNPGDYTIAASPVVIAAGSTSATFTVTILDDTLDEPDETVIFTMGAPTNATAGATTVHTATITDNDLAPTVSFTAASQSAPESAGTITVTASLPAASSFDVTVPFSLSGTASNPADYTSSPSPITIAAGSTSATVSIVVIDDALDEDDETIVVTMGAPTNATAGATTVHTATITDNDPPPGVSFTAASQTGAESVGTMTVTAQLSLVSGRPVTVPFTLSGTAASPADYATTASPIVIPAGSTAANVTITVFNDTLHELDETVIVTMGAPTNAASGATTVHTATITNNDPPPSVSFTAASQSTPESAPSMIATAQLSAVSGLDVTVPFAVSGTAANPADYAITPSPLVIPAGSTSANVTIMIVNDTLDEADESVVVTMGSPTNATAGATAVHTATITDNDLPPTVNFTAPSQGAAESAGTMTVTAQLSAISSFDVTVPFAASGTALLAADYTITASPITIPAGSTSAAITIAVINDTLDEDDETVVITLGAPANATVGASGVHTATITDDEALPSVTFTAALQGAAESAGTMTVTAQLSAISGRAVTLPVSLSGTASRPTDYTTSANPLVIPAGNTSASITITVIDDALDEDDEAAIVTMGAPVNATAGATIVHTATIADNDEPPTVGFAAAGQNAAESAGSIPVVVQLSTVSGRAVTVPFTVSGTADSPADYATTASPITIPAGSTSASITVTIINDTVDEPNETVVATIGAPTNALAGAIATNTTTIVDDDGEPTVSFATTAQTQSEGAGSMTVRVELSNLSSLDVSVPFAVMGTASAPADYTITASPIVIPAGSLFQDIAIAVADDSIVESDETVVITMGTPANAAVGVIPVHTATIGDNEGTPTVSFAVANQSAAETAGTVTVIAGLSAFSSSDVTLPFTVSGTAVRPDDYSITASPIVIPAGSLTATLTITLASDALDETDETIIITMGAPVNAQPGAVPVHTLTITNDDPAPNVQFATASQTVSESTGTAAIKAQLSAISGRDVTVPFTLSGTASAFADFTASASPLVIPAGGASATLTLTLVADNMDEPDETIVVTMGAPTNATAGATTAHTVTLTDANAPPTVTFSTAAQPVAESTGTATVTLQLSSASAFDVVVPLAVSGTASTPQDFTATLASVTIPAGTASASVIAAIAGDTLDEADETIIISMGTPANATPGANPTETVTILDDDAPPAVFFSSDGQSVSEGAGSLAIAVVLSAPSSFDVAVPLTASGTAKAPADYSLGGNAITIAAGSMAGAITMALVDDLVAETGETVVLALGPPAGAVLGTPGMHTVTIIDNESAPRVQFSAGAQTVAETAGGVSLTVVLSSPSSSDVSVPWSVSGTASRSADYTSSPGPLVIPAGSASATITINVASDALDEPDETVIVALGAPTGAMLGATPAHTMTITDDDAPPTVTFTAADQNAPESAGTMTVTALLSAVSGFDVTLPFAMTGTASDPADYTTSMSPLVIPAGSTSAPLAITVINDTLDELDETVVVTMGAPTNATAGATAVHTATITDDDSLPTVSFTAASQNGAESAGIMTVTALLSAVSTFDVTVAFAVTGTASEPADYTMTASPLVIPAGSTSSSLTITVIDDTLPEDDETVIVTMRSLTNVTAGTTTAHRATLTDNDALAVPGVSFTAASQSAAESAGNLTVTAQLSGVSGRDVTVPFTLSGTASNPADYMAMASPIVIPTGSMSASITLTVVDDALDEDDETVIVTMGMPTNASAGATTVHTATIADNDPAPSVSFAVASQSAAESAGSITITVQLSAVSGRDVTVPLTLSGTSSAIADFVAAGGSITIPAGSLSATITITLISDTVDEPNETIVVTMGTPSNATPGAVTTGTATIVDDDGEPTVSFGIASQVVGEGAGTRTIRVALSNPSSLDVTLPFTVAGTASTPADYTISASPLVIPAGTVFRDITITVVDDSFLEGDETVIVTMGTPTNASRGLIPEHTVTIGDNEGIPAVTFSQPSQTVVESSGTVTVRVLLSAISGSDVTVPFTASGTASSSTDFAISASPLVIPAGSSSAELTLTVVDDALDEDNETVVVTLASGAVHTATIVDNDGQPTVSFAAASQLQSEGAGTVSARAELSNVSNVDVTVPFGLTGTATAPGDYTVSASPLIIPAGSLFADITFTIADDNVLEGDETVVVTMATPTNASLGVTTVHTVTIGDNEGTPSVDFTIAAAQVPESAAGVTVTVQLSVFSSTDVTVPFTVSGTAVRPDDYEITASPIVIPVGSRTASVTIAPVHDAFHESDETIVITMGTPVNAQAGAVAVHTVTLVDDDLTPFVQFASASDSAREDAGTVTVAVRLSAAAGQDVAVPFTLPGTAASPGDYTSLPASPIVIPAGMTTATMVFTIVDDSLDEADETIVITMQSPINATPGAQSLHTITIADNDVDTSIASAPAAKTTSATAHFDFTATKAGSTFECSAGGAVFAPCASSTTLSNLAQGAHQLAVRAVAPWGATDPTPATHSWTIDAFSPETGLHTTLGTVPPVFSNSTSATFDFSSNETGVTYECNLDGSGFIACGNPAIASDLSDGQHTFAVRGRDATGNVDPTPTIYTWTVDTTLPDTRIVTGPPSTLSPPTVTFDFESNEPDATYQCDLDGSGFSPCSDPATWNALALGDHVLAVRARDRAGNADSSPATWSFRVEPFILDTAIVSGPPAVDSSPTAAFDFSSNDPAATFECRLDGDAFVACGDPTTFTGLSAGAHTLAVRARDGSGNADTTPAGYAWTLDTALPDTAIVSGPPLTDAPTTATFDFGSNKTDVTYECQLDGVAGFTFCNDPSTFVPLAQGVHHLAVRAKDPAGHVDPSPAVFDWSVNSGTIDTVIVAAPPTHGASPRATFRFASNRADATFECKLDDEANFSTCPSPTTWDALTEGAHRLQVRAKDPAGNLDPTPAIHSWNIDARVPDTMILTGPPLVNAPLQATFDFASDEPDVIFECKIDNATGFTPCTDPLSLAQLTPGMHRIEVRAKDPAGNADATPASYDWSVDNDADHDGLVDAEEKTLGTDPANPDTDHDGLPDTVEVKLAKTNPLDDDTDDDGLLDGSEDANHDGHVDSGETSPLLADSDSDGLQDGTEEGRAAPQGNGTDLARFVPDADPATRTDPLKRDTDDGSVFDGFEDLNHNGRIDPGETDPNRRSDDIDADGDGIGNAVERMVGTDPFDADSDHDGVPDGFDGLKDTDGDGRIDALDPDSDNDGLNDGQEDKNANGVLDPGETNPRNPDSDSGGALDGKEAARGTDPLNSRDDFVVAGGCQILGRSGEGSPVWVGIILALWYGRWRRYRSRPLVCLQLIAIVVLAALVLATRTTSAQPATARSIDVQHFKPAAGVHDLPTVESARLAQHRQLNFIGYLNYAGRPLRLIDPVDRSTQFVLLGHQLALDLGASIGLYGRAEVGVLLPLTLSQGAGSGPPPIPSFPANVSAHGFGDLRLMAKIRVFEAERFMVSGSLLLALPTGNQGAYLGWGIGLFPRALVEYSFANQLRLLGNLGVALREHREFISLNLGRALTFGLGAEMPFRVKGQEFYAIGALAGETGGLTWEKSPVEFSAGGRWQVTRELSVLLGGGPGLTSGYGTPVFRVWMGLTWAHL